MATMNCARPITYSQLFRPWDNGMDRSEIDMTAVRDQLNFFKTEYSVEEAMEGETIDIINCSESERIDCDDSHCSPETSPENSPENSPETSPESSPKSSPEKTSKTSFRKNLKTSPESSRNSSLNLTFDDCESEGLSRLDTPNSERSCLTSKNSQLPNTNLFNTTTQYYQNHQHQLASSQHYQQMTMFSGLAPSAAEAATNNYYYAAAAAAVANSVNVTTSLPNFNMDTYPLGLMEQEYARVMAEEAHLKALNARKQRPKKFKCPHCEVAFSNNGQLKGHIRIHTGERPFKCDAEGCGKTFTRNEELTRHKRIHTGLRPFPCGACGKKFGRRDHLKKHMKTHMPQEHPLTGSPAFFMPVYPYIYGL